jgi:hypothetical protein
MPPAIYYLGGILVRATTKAIKDRLIAQGFRKATRGQIDSKIPVVTGTENNLIALITRAKNAIKSDRVVGSGGRNVARRKKPEDGNLLGNRGQSEFARKYGKRKMGGFGPVKSTRVKEAKDLKLAQGKRAKAKAESSAKPAPLKLTNAQRVFKPSAKSSEVAGNRSGSTPTIVAIAPSASSADEASSKIPSVQTKARKTSTQVQRKARADAAAKRKVADEKPAKEGSLVGDAGKPSNRRAAKDANTTARKKAIERAVAEANKPTRPKLRPKTKDISLRTYLNQEIKKKKSTVAKEKAKAKKGGYTSIASAKKAKSLYYIKDGKPRAAVYKEELKGK